MDKSVRQKAFEYLHSLLSRIDTIPDYDAPVVLRNEPEAVSIPKGGLIILRDGEVMEAGVVLSPVLYEIHHQLEIVVQVQHTCARIRDGHMDILLQSIAASISYDINLSGIVDNVSLDKVEFLDEPIEGAETIKAALITVVVEYSSDTLLG